VILSLEQVRHVAGLARLSLGAEEEQRSVEQLSAIVEAVEKLSELDTEAVVPTAWASLGPSELRPDEVRPSLGAQRAVQSAPASVGSSFAVPRVLG
jgi:aspartyl-tRNA(Asn)/glutamyl-tRNA(Gln) amidotransferase subunit C